MASPSRAQPAPSWAAGRPHPPSLLHVEMMVARSRALTLVTNRYFNHTLFSVEMMVARSRALTPVAADSAVSAAAE